MPNLVESKARNSGSAALKKSFAVGVIGVKGGVGATTLAINLAAQAAASTGKSVRLFDANLQQPDIACLLDLKPRFSIADLVERKDNLSPSVLDACLTAKPLTLGALQVVSPPLDCQSALLVSMDNVVELFTALQGLDSGFWIVDLPKTIDSSLVTLLDALDKIVLVIEPTVPCLAACARWLSLLSELGYESSRLLVVMNRAFGKVKAIETRLSESLGAYTLLKVVNAYEAAENACLLGLPLVETAKNSPYTKSVAKVLESLRSGVADV